jgi:hypothetical protein
MTVSVFNGRFDHNPSGHKTSHLHKITYCVTSTECSIQNATLPTTHEPLKHKTTKPMAISNSCSRIALLLLIYSSKSQGRNLLFCRSTSTCHRQLQRLKNFFKVGALLSYPVLPCQDTHCYTLRELRRATVIQKKMFKNTQHSHRRSLCATSISSGLVGTVTLTRL